MLTILEPKERFHTKPGKESMGIPLDDKKSVTSELTTREAATHL